MVTTGETAPDFRLPGTEGGEVNRYRLGDYTDGGVVVLAFYVFDFHPSCTEELCTIRNLGWFDLMDEVTVFAVGTDRVFSHRAFASEHRLEFPLLSDSDGNMSEAYDVLYDELDGHKRISKRAVFVIDDDRTARYRWVAEDPGIQPDWGEVESTVKSIVEARAGAP